MTPRASPEEVDEGNGISPQVIDAIGKQAILDGIAAELSLFGGPQKLSPVNEGSSPTGLPNVGNSCFQNACFQFLSAGLYTTPLAFSSPLISNVFAQLRSAKKNDPGRFIEPLKRILCDLEHRDKLAEKMRQSDKYVVGQMYDASQFLSYIVKEESLYRSFKVSSKVHLSCSSCKALWRNDTDVSWSLDLSVDRQSTIQDLLEKHCERENVSLTCRSCDKTGCVSISREIELDPQTKSIIFFLKRDVLTGPKTVQYESDISFGTKLFRLASCMIHTKEPLHYFTISRREENDFFEFNDSVVRNISSEEAFSHGRNVCALMYVAVETRPEAVEVKTGVKQSISSPTIYVPGAIPGAIPPLAVGLTHFIAPGATTRDCSEDEEKARKEERYSEHVRAQNEHQNIILKAIEADTEAMRALYVAKNGAIDLCSPTKPKEACPTPPPQPTTLPKECLANEGLFAAEVIPNSKEESVVLNAFANGKALDEVLASYYFSFLTSEKSLTRKDLRTLRYGVWLNDEVINCTMDLMQERENRRHRTCTSVIKKAPRVQFLSTFFYKKVCEIYRFFIQSRYMYQINFPIWLKLFADQKYSYDSVKRWLQERKLGYNLFDCDMIVMPINQNNSHWVLIIINLQMNQIEFYDRREPQALRTI